MAILTLIFATLTLLTAVAFVGLAVYIVYDVAWDFWDMRRRGGR